CARHPCYTCPSLFIYYSANHRPLHSFPTRRSSDLLTASYQPSGGANPKAEPISGSVTDSTSSWLVIEVRFPKPSPPNSGCGASRSEEHTSELQSPYELVCRLLPEKKKNKISRKSNS